MRLDGGIYEQFALCPLHQGMLVRMRRVSATSVIATPASARLDVIVSFANVS